jgi:hypothetical protein
MSSDQGPTKVMVLQRSVVGWPAEPPLSSPDTLLKQMLESALGGKSDCLKGESG